MNNAIVDLNDALEVSSFGGKATNLAKMLQSGLPVPDGFAVGLDAFGSEGTLLDEGKAKLTSSLKPDVLYAVRSSALAEDADGASWAGQFESFLDTKAEGVLAKIEECHNSAKARAHAYASSQSDSSNFAIAVVVQEMIKPEYAGVLFTKDPITGADKLVTEYVEGLGEALVSGQADPTQIIWSPGDDVVAPFSIKQLTELAQKVESVFGSPQDIEWAWADNKMWLVQARPITATQTSGKGYYLGEPEELFYWGPSRAKPMYMSDFMTAAEVFFTSMVSDPSMPNPPQTLVLFHAGKMVWLNNAAAFGEFAEKTFEAYEKRDKLRQDVDEWKKTSEALDELDGNEFDEALLKAWSATLFAEFSLYGAESSLAKRLDRFSPEQKQQIWGTLTVPDKTMFLAKIDEELLASDDPTSMAGMYPWVQDGYDGVAGNAKEYFEQRLEILKENGDALKPEKNDRTKLSSELGLTESEVHSLTLARELAEFMDDRKAWMMQTRRLIKRPLGDIQYGWSFVDGESTQINESDTAELWERYVDFRASTNAVKGIVASNGGKHFVNGEVAVASSPTDNVGDGKILVVPSTSPSYVPLMRKAKALITDHGGMMSHAAIVAREFGLPCIVGTKQATKVLKDGDKVVLDLVRGEVNK